jgi:hypothetical protein
MLSWKYVELGTRQSIQKWSDILRKMHKLSSSNNMSLGDKIGLAVCGLSLLAVLANWLVVPEVRKILGLNDVEKSNTPQHSDSRLPEIAPQPNSQTQEPTSASVKTSAKSHVQRQARGSTDGVAENPDVTPIMERQKPAGAADSGPHLDAPVGIWAWSSGYSNGKPVFVKFLSNGTVQVRVGWADSAFIAENWTWYRVQDTIDISMYNHSIAEQQGTTFDCEGKTSDVAIDFKCQEVGGTQAFTMTLKRVDESSP